MTSVLLLVPAHTFITKFGGPNDFSQALVRQLGPESEWMCLCRIAFGLARNRDPAPRLREEVTAGLRPYCETARRLDDVLEPDDRALVRQTVARIQSVWE